MATETHIDKIDSEDAKAQRLAMYIYILPNLMTTGNLFSGFFAVIQSIKGNYLYAAYAIVVAAIFDQLDGRLARLTRSTSKFGAEYDSLCDLVSFGMAPGVLLFLWALQPFGRLGWVACFLFVACGALRLARFNVQANVVEKNYFQGLPIPMAAGIVASSVLAFQDLELEPLGNYGLLVMTILLALVMVSNFRFRSFKDLDLKERLPFRYLILGLGVLVVVALRPEVMLFVLFMAYAALGAVFGVFKLGKNIRKIKPSVYAPASVHESDLVLEEEEEEAAKDEKKT
ncbi:CDP-diacylglycerol--serine O-phosphatidyltransferase [Bdellovibrio bacteriovorus]|uniref:CDP-diacylglycerol--serine O-phosphatidyltransferase n=1 Tax=Bdellovibrio bacteriovorus TaxID=959 RepID=UPI0021D0CEB3|nr:CDP-diacylglycerol--serine O-phosphatidyltransferase [Bdellovibrio bacteriovorus]UXR64962.1 CDP-diacylglycerol--serine O-phosphatidyltransferase [Bdellovibrio bacteriovorus]